MQVAAVLHDRYWGTAELRQTEMAEIASPLEIWARMTGVSDRKPQTIEAGYIEDWDAYGSHHEGMVTMIWWGETANAQAEAKYQELRQQGVLTYAEMAQKIREAQPKAN